jgi:RND family efflux transporter MFP subunit
MSRLTTLGYSSQTWLLLSAMAMTWSCTKSSGDKVSLPPPKSTASEPTSGAAAPEPSKQEASVEVQPAADVAAANTQNQPSAPESSQSSTGASSGSEVQAASPSAKATVEPGRITPSPANDLGSATDYRLTGEVTAARHSQVAFRVPGFLSTIAAKPGTVAKKGALLATLDDRDYVLRLELAKARREQARIALESAQKELKRESDLKSANASTATVFDKIKAQADQARLALKLAELDYEGAELALKDTKLTAPYDSVVATQLKYEGENVQGGTAVFEVYDTAEPEISLTVPERLLGQITVGTKLTITIQSAGYKGPGVIIRQVPVISERTRTFKVTVKLDKYDPKIVSGLYAEGVLN